MKSFRGIIYLTFMGACFGDKLSSYGGFPSEPLNQYSSGGLVGAGSSFLPLATSPVIVDPIVALESALPGIPGEDYPILAEVPETSFSCEGQVEGGYYADPDTECQAFHVCAADGEAFICDWWFNFDCSQATALYSKNEEIAVERSAAGAAGGLIGSGSARQGYGAPTPSGTGYPAPGPAPSTYGSPAPAPRPAPAPSAYGSPAPRPAPVPSAYGSPTPSVAPRTVPAPAPKPAPTPSSYGSPAPPLRPAPASSAYGSPVPIPAPFPAPSVYGSPAPIPSPIPVPPQPFYLF
ncbi:unnamed protein product [Lepeophtheirus salmonis]|uniref:(salmon louse) hypothetical protein n=1 Tax=Lepeophtheirus salmonis TaxID=72036 RepID=A0A7R8CL50_LEPSM|nr:unnamed protein product [Lepeophtheirus salmonis]CAF2850065.1 unnamed protein product [Lepeophtheirus salmonis]